jgi:D-aminopeptidase
MLSTTALIHEPLRYDEPRQWSSPGAFKYAAASTVARYSWYHTHLTHRPQQSYSVCRQQHGQAAICAQWPGVKKRKGQAVRLI